MKAQDQTQAPHPLLQLRDRAGRLRPSRQKSTASLKQTTTYQMPEEVLKHDVLPALPSTPSPLPDENHHQSFSEESPQTPERRGQYRAIWDWARIGSRP